MTVNNLGALKLPAHRWLRVSDPLVEPQAEMCVINDILFIDGKDETQFAAFFQGFQDDFFTADYFCTRSIPVALNSGE